jgi:hypothetical protein
MTPQLEKMVKKMDREAASTAPVPVYESLGQFRETNRPWVNWVFVGCGGNHYYLQPYLYKVAKDAETLMWIDPDKLEQGNLDRQWPTDEVGDYKAFIAGDHWPPGTRSDITTMCQAHACTVEELQKDPEWWKSVQCVGKKGERGVVIVCLPDNDVARVESAVMLERMIVDNKADHGVVIVAGTDLNRGQAYYGVRGPDKWLHDWRTLHPDIQTQTPEEAAAGCGQTAPVNIQTAVITAQCIEEALYAKGDEVHEFHWGLRPGTDGERFLTWTEQVTPEPDDRE